MPNNLTLEDCKKALERFVKATDRAEQHSFVALAFHHAMLNRMMQMLERAWDKELAKNMIDRCNALCKQLGAEEVPINE